MAMFDDDGIKAGSDVPASFFNSGRQLSLNLMFGELFDYIETSK
jgi:hypothetical protein